LKERAACNMKLKGQRATVSFDAAGNIAYALR